MDDKNRPTMNVKLRPDIHKRVKLIAVQTDKTINEVVDRLLRGAVKNGVKL